MTILSTDRVMSIDRILGELEGATTYVETCVCGKEGIVFINREGLLKILNQTISYLEEVKRRDKAK